MDKIFKLSDLQFHEKNIQNLKNNLIWNNYPVSFRRNEHHDNYFQSRKNYNVISKHKLHNSGHDLIGFMLKFCIKEKTIENVVLHRCVLLKSKRINL